MANATLAEISAILNNNNDHVDKHAYGQIVDVVDKVIGHDATTGAEVTKQFYKVSIGGSIDEVECTRLVGAAIGDTVMVMTMANGYSVVTGRVGGDKDSIDVQKNLDTAQTIINSALSTIRGRLNTAESVTNTIIDLAETAGETTAQILNAWQTSTELVGDMQEAADEAGKTLDKIVSDSVKASETVQTMEDYAQTAGKELVKILEDGEKAGTAAQEALDNAKKATSSANGALNGLSTVQDVIGVLEWAKKNAVFALTEDRTVTAGKSYYTVTGTEVTPTGDENPSQEGWYEMFSRTIHYPEGESVDILFYQKTTDTTVDSSKNYYTIEATPVTNPTGDPLEHYYYEISGVDEAMADFINTHLALTDEGLYVLGGANQWKVLIAPDGVYIIDGTSGVDKVVAKYKDAITLGIDDGTENFLLEDYRSLKMYDMETAEQLVKIEAAEPFSTEKTYNEGDYVIHNGAPEECVNAVTTPGAYDPSNWQLVTPTPYLWVSDLREWKTIDGERVFALDVVCMFEGDGETTEFRLSPTAYSVNYKVYLNGTDVSSSVTRSTYKIKFNTAPRSWSKIRVEYVTDSDKAKAFTFGERSFADDVGAMSFAEGVTIQAGGYASHAEGQQTKANGERSHAEGYLTEANGVNSHAQNDHTIAGYSAQTAIGIYNKNQEYNAFEVGNGTLGVRSNAFAVAWDGNVRMCLNNYQTAGNVDKTIYDALNSLGWLSDCTES